VAVTEMLTAADIEYIRANYVSLEEL